MTRQLIYLPEAVEDFREGKNYYEELSPGRGGARFEDAFKEAIRQIKDGLVTHAAAFGHFHRLNLRRFPYTLYYRLIGEKPVIVAVLYSRWDPKRIQRTLARR
jgi:plasmid stabilization system protein ParE